MKRFAFVALLCAIGSAPAEPPKTGKAKSGAARTGYDKLSANFKSNAGSHRIKNYAVTIKGQKVHLANSRRIKGEATDGNGETVQIGVKFAAELAGPAPDYKPTGEMVNLATYKWKPGQRFFLWFDSAVPVTFAIHQKLTAGGEKTVAPDEAFPTSLQTSTPNEKWRFPLRFKLDDNADDETLTLQFVRADQEELQPPGEKGEGDKSNDGDKPVVPPGGDANSPTGDSVEGVGATIKRIKFAMDDLHKKAKTGKVNGRKVKCSIDGPIEGDVWFTATGEGKVAEVTITVHKTPDV